MSTIEIVDQDEIQFQDESSVEWVKMWKKEVVKKRRKSKVGTVLSLLLLPVLILIWIIGWVLYAEGD